MSVLNKLSVAAITSVAAFLSAATFAAPAQAILLKCRFEGKGVNGYFIYDSTTAKSQPEGQPSTELSWEHYGSVLSYSVNFAGSDGQISEHGQRGSQTDITNEARNVVYLSRPGSSGYEGNNEDDFILYLPPAIRGQQYGLSVRLSFPEGTLSPEGDLPTSLPRTARVRAYPYWDFPISTGYDTFEGTVKIKLERIPEPTSSLPWLAVGDEMFNFSALKSKQVVTVMTPHTSPAEYVWAS